jgi:mono/diheme cytochrome c family protein
MFQVRIWANKTARWPVPLAAVRTASWLSLILLGGLTQTLRQGTDPVGAANILRPFLSENCYACHGSRTKTAGMDLEAYVNRTSILEDRAMGESVLRMLKSGLMPPAGMRRPNEGELRAVIKKLEDALETSGAAPKPENTSVIKPDPGNVPPHRLNRAEYNNTIRDLLGVDIHNSGRRRNAARPLHAGVWQQYQRRQQSHSREPAGGYGRAGRRYLETGTAYYLSRNPDDESLSCDAGKNGSAHGQTGRQHRPSNTPDRRIAQAAANSNQNPRGREERNT